MLRVGDKITITENNGGQSMSVGWVVLEYDNGLLKVRCEKETKIFNMRSTAFHSVEYAQ